MTETFAVGDVVRLKSGGPLMTVIGVHSTELGHLRLARGGSPAEGQSAVRLPCRAEEP